MSLMVIGRCSFDAQYVTDNGKMTFFSYEIFQRLSINGSRDKFGGQACSYIDSEACGRGRFENIRPHSFQADSNTTMMTILRGALLLATSTCVSR